MCASPGPQLITLHLALCRHLSGNRIETVNGLTFKHLAELRVLQLRNNRIRVLQPGAFHGLNNIEKL